MIQNPISKAQKQKRQFLSTIFKKVVFLIDAVQMTIFVTNVIEYYLKRALLKPATTLQAHISFFVIMAYFLLTFLVLKTSTKTDMITLLAVVIFAIHQMQIFIKIDPFEDVNKQPVFRYESLLHLYSSIVMVGTFLPMKYYLPPVLFIYTWT